MNPLRLKVGPDAEREIERIDDWWRAIVPSGRTLALPKEWRPTWIRSEGESRFHPVARRAAWSAAPAASASFADVSSKPASRAGFARSLGPWPGTDASSREMGREVFDESFVEVAPLAPKRLERFAPELPLEEVYQVSA